MARPRKTPAEATTLPNPEKKPKLLRVRATINLPGLNHNQFAVVDPAVPYIADCLREGYIVPTE